MATTSRQKQPAKTLPTSGVVFYRDGYDDSLYRVGTDGIPAILRPDGNWHPHPAMNYHEVQPITEAAAKQLAGDADLTAAVAATPPAARPRAAARGR